MRQFTLIMLVIGLLAVPWIFDNPFDKADSRFKRQLYVYNWSDYIQDDIIPTFQEQSGIKVHYDVFDSAETLQGKLLLGKSGYDIVAPSTGTAIRQIEAGIFQPLDKSKISNYKHVDPNILRLLQEEDPGNRYLIPNIWGANTIGGNITEIKKRIPDWPENEWDLLFDPKYASKLQSCGISILDSYSEIYPIVLHYLGKNTKNPSKADLKAANETLRKIRPYLKRFSSSGYINDLASGELCLALGFNGDFTIARERTEEAGKPLDIHTILPKNGVGIWVDNLAIASTAENIDESYAFIDYLLDPKIAARNAEYVTYGSGCLTARKHMDENLAQNEEIFLPDRVLDKSFLITKLPKEDLRWLSKQWTLLKKN